MLLVFYSCPSEYSMCSGQVSCSMTYCADVSCGSNTELFITQPLRFAASSLCPQHA